MVSPLSPLDKFLDVLRVHEDELVFTLGVNVRALCENFCSEGLLSCESRAHFTSLDHSRLTPQFLVRYLVRLASERIKTDLAWGHNLIKVLNMEGVPSSLTDELNRVVDVRGPTKHSGIVGVLPVKVAGETAGHKEQEIVFTKKDQSKLTEWLVTVSHKWKALALLLGIPVQEISFVNEKYSLYKCLGIWLAGSPNPTWSKLKAALCSKLVCEAVLAQSLEETVKNAKANQSKRSKVTSGIVSQSLPTEVADGKSTLLQVQARPRESVVSYQWSKDGQSLANSSRYSGVDDDILVVRHASQGTDGEYTCCVSLQDRQVTSNPITLTVHFSPAKNLLLNLYSWWKEVPFKNDWPPVVSTTFINLALVKSSFNKKNKTDLSVRGDADDIIAEKKMIEYYEVFGEYKSNELILVVGRPGSGKTTLVHKVVKDWALGKALAKSKLTLLLTLRLLNDSQDETLEKVLQALYSDEDAIAILPDIRDGEGVCFVLDGLDEYQPQNREKSVILNLLDRKCFPNSMIIVFTRPSATEQLNKDLISKTIEVFGFKKEQIFEYIDNFPFDEDYTSDTRASQLKYYLHCHPNILDMCYLPIHAAMICFLFQFDGNISSTQTKLYKEFTRLIIHCHLARNLKKHAVRSLDNLGKPHAEFFKNLCCLAYEMTIRNIQVIRSQELPAQLGGSGSLSEDRGLGLVTICPTLRQTGFHQSYAFLHLTFQEFLTAYYIANYMDDSQQMDILQKYCDMKTLWLFYSGLVNFEGPFYVKLLKMLLESLSGMELFHYALESGQQVVCDYIVKRNSGRFVFPQLSHCDMLCIGYVLKTSSEPIRDLTFAGYTYDENQVVSLLLDIENASEICFLNSLEIGFLIGDSGTKMLCNVLQCANNIDNLVLSIGHHYPLFGSSLSEAINICTKLSRLNISYAGTSECIMSFVSSLKCCLKYLCLLFDGLNQQSIEALGKGCVSLRPDRLDLKISASYFDKDNLSLLVGNLQHVQSLHLDLSCNGIDNSAIAQMACRCEKNKDNRLRQLSLSSNGIDPAGARSLAEGLKFMSGLKRLELSHNIIGPAGASAIAEELKSVTGLTMLDLSHNNIGPAGASAIAEELKSVTGLTMLDLSHNNIGPAGASAIAEELKSVTGLTMLDLSHNNIGPAGASAIAEELKSVTGLTMLDLSHNNIGPAGASAIAKDLKSVTGLTMFDLSHNNISPAGASAIAKELYNVTGLKRLDLSHNDIGSAGASAIAKNLKCVSKLKRLDISHNAVGSSGATELVCNLRLVHGLEYINLVHDDVEHSETDTIETSLRKFEKLKYLLVDDAQPHNPTTSFLTDV